MRGDSRDSPRNGAKCLREMATYAAARPRTPPPKDSRTLSVSTRRMRRKRVAHGRAQPCQHLEQVVGPVNVGARVDHQRGVQWLENSENADEIATAVLFLDDANRVNGCLEVVPGSHLVPLAKGRDVEGFGSFEMDSERFDTDQLVALEVPAGSVVFFGPRLVHRSLPNTTDGDRRTLLFSYQPAGRSTSSDFLARMVGANSRETVDR